MAPKREWAQRGPACPDDAVCAMFHELRHGLLTVCPLALDL